MNAPGPAQDFQVFPPDGDGVAKAARLLLNGELVAMPTETVYGLAGDATNDQAVARIYAAKGRPQFNPLITHFGDENEAWQQVDPNQLAGQLAAAFWPGPLTLVLPRRKESTVSLLASAGLDTLAVRVPAHPTARLLLATAGIPLAAPSANPSGTVSPTRASHVTENPGHGIAGIIDGGDCKIGIESTVIGFPGDSALILRPGGIAQEDIEAVIGPLTMPAADTGISSPGMLDRHYAPDTPLRLNMKRTGPGELMLGYGPHMPLDAPDGSLNLSPTGDLTEAAANVFAMLRELDSHRSRSIAVMPIPDRGLGRAINDRLRRAASTC